MGIVVEMKPSRAARVRTGEALVSGLCFERGGRFGAAALALMLSGCGDVGSGRDGTPSGVDPSEPLPLSEIEEGLDRPLSDAADHLRNESNWIVPDPRDDDDDDDTGPSDGGDNDGGSCVGQCGGSANESCFCDASCSASNDCCSDYEQACGGDNPGDGGTDGGDANDDGGSEGDGGSEPAGSCAGACGEAGSGGACYCDSLCTDNGDCCTDYQAKCGGPSDGDAGDAGDDGGDADPASCVGFCGGAGVDCYCDATCVEAGDCCADYDSVCAVGIVAPVSLDITVDSAPVAGNGACWGIIADPLDVQKVAEQAAIGGTLFGSTCVAVVVVPAGGAAIPSGGTSVAAAAIACGTATLGGAAVGALSSFFGQKMPGVVECGGNVVQSVMQSFPWGIGEKKVSVPVFRPPPADPGNCSPDEQSTLQSNVSDACKEESGTVGCKAANGCTTIAAKVQRAADCIAARSKINSQCYDGGDSGHKDAVQQQVNLQVRCEEFAAALGC